MSTPIHARGLSPTALIVSALLLCSAACDNDERVVGPNEPEPEPPTFLAIVSNPSAIDVSGGVGLATAGAGEVAYVSLPPATVPGGETARITNQRTGETVVAAVVAGGFDPVQLGAESGDTLQLAVQVAGSPNLIRSRSVVPPRRRPIVVRTDPPPQKRDVPLNASLVVVFSEPLDPGSVSTSTLQLLLNATPVSGTVRLVPASPWTVEFVPATDLAAETTYELVVTQAVLDLDGDTLDPEVRVEFTTGTASTPAVSTIAAGHSHSCGLDASGAAYCWGDNSVGQLGNGSTVSSSRPVPVLGGLRFSSVAAGVGHTCGLALTGRAYCWGNNRNGELGNGGSSARSWVPVAVVGGLTFSTLAAGSGHTCGLATNGSIWCWGVNDESQLGNGVGPSPYGYGQFSETPVLVRLGYRFIGLAAGGGHTCGLSSDGAAYCWGANSDGQLGLGSTLFSTEPALVPGELSFFALVAGVRHTCGLTTAGTAYCWGANADGGQLGDGSLTNKSSPVAVTGGLRFTALAAGGFHTCGLTAAGPAYCWGWNNDGQLGNGSIESSSNPIAVSVGQSFTALAAGFTHTCGRTVSADLYCWGNDEAEQLGRGMVAPWTPAPVAGLSTATVIGTGGYHSCALTGGGAAFCWGDNTWGQLGSASTARRATPLAVQGGLSFSIIRTHSHHTCGITVSGEAYCWGYNEYGQLGDGAFTNSAQPVAVAGGLSFVDIAPGYVHTCGLTHAGITYCWGHGGNGKLGHGATTSSPIPVAVSGNLSFVAITAAYYHTCGLATTGAAYCWGNNGSGELGNNSSEERLTPDSVVGGIRFRTLTANLNHSCGIAESGVAYCWGQNGFGQLGYGVTTQRTSPVAVRGGLTFRALAAGSFHTCGVTVSGEPHCWGYNYEGQLGNGSSRDYSPNVTPTPVVGLAGLNFSSIGAGDRHTCGLTSSGALYCWGQSHHGQLGRGTLGYETGPVPVAPFSTSAPTLDVPSFGASMFESAPAGRGPCAATSPRRWSRLDPRERLLPCGSGHD